MCGYIRNEPTRGMFFQRLQSPIHIAAEMGHTDICKLLLAAGANIEQREKVQDKFFSLFFIEEFLYVSRFDMRNMGRGERGKLIEEIERVSGHDPVGLNLFVYDLAT